MNKKIIKDATIITLFFFIEELIFKILINSFTIDYSLLRILLLSGILAIIISYIANLFKNKKIKIIFIITISLLMSIYALAQLGFIAYFGIYMSANTGGQLGAVKA